MKINGYKLDIVCANVLPDRTYGDIYDEVEQCVQEHPEEEIRFGYYLNKENADTPDWFDSIDDAIAWASQN